VRRDISAEVDEEVSYHVILAGLAENRPATVTEISLFDIYRGSGVGKGRKSLAFRVLLQDTRKTLTEAEVESAVEALRQVLQQRFNAKLR
jgi:phenylalanyl-tRNA synthetase beta chain